MWAGPSLLTAVPLGAQGAAGEQMVAAEADRDRATDTPRFHGLGTFALLDMGFRGGPPCHAHSVRPGAGH